MTTDQLRDELAGLMGHTPIAGSDGWYRSPVTGHTYPHPVTLSLDWLAAHGLPEGWKWTNIAFDQRGFAWAKARIDDSPLWNTDRFLERIVSEGAPTELHARLAACVAAWKATKGTQ